MNLECVRTGKTLCLNNEQVDYITSLIKKIDLEQEFKEFLEYDSDGYECITASWLIDAYIGENKIFEMKVGDNLKPVVLDDNISKLPANCQPLSLQSLEFLSEVSEFLISSQEGIRIT